MIDLRLGSEERGPFFEIGGKGMSKDLAHCRALLNEDIPWASAHLSGEIQSYRME